VSTHIGVRLKIVTPWGDLLVSDSDQLYWKAQLITGFKHGVPGNPLLTSDDDYWAEIFPGDGQAFNGSRDVLVLVRPVLLADVDDIDDPPTRDGYPLFGPGPVYRRRSRWQRPWWQRWRYRITPRVRRTSTAVPV
jgi:hypothetical protein